LVPLMLRVPCAGWSDTVKPVGDSAGNMQAFRSIVTALFNVVLLVHAEGAGTPTEKFTVMAALVPAALVAVKVTGVLAVGLVGVPEITPVLVLKLKPAGSVPLAWANDSSGGLLAVMEMGVIATPKASAELVPLDGLVMVGTALGVMVNTTDLVPVSAAVFVACTVTL